MQLRHEIAERADVQLVARRHVPQRVRRAAQLRHQQRTVVLDEIRDLDRLLAHRHENEPREPRIVHQQRGAEIEIAHRRGIGGKARVEVESHVCG